jgi:ubiquinone biosynthesis protein UbiJ
MVRSDRGTRVWPAYSPEEEKEMLQEQVAYLKRQIEAISKRVQELEQKSEG